MLVAFLIILNWVSLRDSEPLWLVLPFPSARHGRHNYSRTQPVLLRREITHVFLNIFGKVGSLSFGREPSYVLFGLHPDIDNSSIQINGEARLFIGAVVRATY